jgi:hypothetical protein
MPDTLLGIPIRYVEGTQHPPLVLGPPLLLEEVTAEGPLPLTEEEFFAMASRAAVAFVRYLRTGERPSPREAWEVEIMNQLAAEAQIRECPARLDLLAELVAEFPPPA